MQAASMASKLVSFENGFSSETALLTLDIRPPPSCRELLTASRHSRCIQVRPATPETQFVSRYAFPLTFTRSRASPSMRPAGPCVFLLFEANETRTSRLRNFDTELRYPYCYRFESDNRLESSPTRTPPPICTSAPILNPRWSQEPWALRTL